MTETLNIAQMIADAEAAIVRMEGVRLKGMIASHNRVVIAHGDFALGFDYTDNGDGTKSIINARMVQLWKAPQFTPSDAARIAAACTDGAGRPARAMYINDAVDMMVAAQRQFIETLRSLPA